MIRDWEKSKNMGLDKIQSINNDDYSRHYQYDKLEGLRIQEDVQIMPNTPHQLCCQVGLAYSQDQLKARCVQIEE